MKYGCAIWGWVESHKDGCVSSRAGTIYYVDQIGLLSPTHYSSEAILVHSYITKFHYSKII